MVDDFYKEQLATTQIAENSFYTEEQLARSKLRQFCHNAIVTGSRESMAKPNSIAKIRQDYEEAAKERDKEMPPFEQVRDDLTKRMSDAFLADYYKDAVKAAKIEWLE